MSFLRFFFHKCNILLHLDVVFNIFLLTVAFFSLQSHLYFSRVLLKIHKTFSYNLSCYLNYACFLCDQTPKLFTLNTHKEYVHLFFLLKISLDYLHTHFIWLHTLIKFQYIILFGWHYNSTKVFIFTYFFMILKFVFYSKRMMTIQTIKITFTLWSYPME